MKKVLLLSMMAGVILASCSDNGNEPANTVIPPPTSETTPTELVITDSQQADAEVFNGSEKVLLTTLTGGICLNFQMEGVTQVVLESVDGYAIAGIASLTTKDGQTSIGEISDAKSIITFSAPSSGTLQSGKDYYITTFPCDLYGGYRLSIYRNGLVAHYFGVHQVTKAGQFISPLDLDESELEFDDPDAPLVEEERPGLNAATKAALVAYQKEPSEENKQALLEQMGTKYDKVVARKKAKLRELEREAKHQSLVDEMQAIVNEMVENRDIRLEQQFLRLIDPRQDDNPNDEWFVLRGAQGNNPYIGYAPVTNAEYKQFKSNFTYTA